jgi:hypothetical protein
VIHDSSLHSGVLLDFYRHDRSNTRDRSTANATDPQRTSHNTSAVWWQKSLGSIRQRRRLQTREVVPRRSRSIVDKETGLQAGMVTFSLQYVGRRGVLGPRVRLPRSRPSRARRISGSVPRYQPYVSEMRLEPSWECSIAVANNRINCSVLN